MRSYESVVQSAEGARNGAFLRAIGALLVSLNENWEVFCDDVTIVEDHHHIHLELNLELLGLERRAGVQPREYHINGHNHVPAEVALAYLDPHDFRRFLLEFVARRDEYALNSS